MGTVCVWAEQVFLYLKIPVTSKSDGCLKPSDSDPPVPMELEPV